ncbi:MAG: hypothetical protein RDU01_03395 [Thermodesulfovibrionales bacterium]|nr:hypothetical protein [Thermodesulfovibrionales bacterium]
MVSGKELDYLVKVDIGRMNAGIWNASLQKTRAFLSLEKTGYERDCCYTRECF